MTTIACDGNSMAADGRATVDNIIITDARRKLVTLADGRVAGGSGEAADVEIFREWLDAGATGDLKVSEDFAGLVLDRHGLVLRGANDGKLLPVPVPVAVGSGMELAIGAMEFGATAEQAVEIAARRDIRTGGDITVLKP